MSIVYYSPLAIGTKIVDCLLFNGRQRFIVTLQGLLAMF